MSETESPPTQQAPFLQALPLEGIPADALHADPLLDCLVELTRLHGHPSSRTALSAGLPVARTGLTPLLF